MKYKIVFLDIDGVLNVIPQGHDRYGAMFHKHFEDNLGILIKKTNAKIVITSTWRSSGLRQMQKMWVHRNLVGEVIAITPNHRWMNLEGEERGYEIQYWLDNNKDIVENYVILDDDIDMLEHQMENFVRTSENIDHEDCVDVGYGLTKICTMKAIEILNKKLCVKRKKY